MPKYKIRITFTETLLGTVALDESAYLNNAGGANAPDQETAIDEAGDILSQRGVTGFLRFPDGTPYLLNYVIKGFFKDTCGVLRRLPDTKSSKLSVFKKIIDGLVFVEPRKIPLHLGGTDKLEVMSRPLRAQTAQGERIALAHSEMCPSGTWIEFDLNVLGVIDEALLREWLDYGRYRGLGQWRNAGYGSFNYQMEPL